MLCNLFEERASSARFFAVLQFISLLVIQLARSISAVRPLIYLGARGLAFS